MGHGRGSGARSTMHDGLRREPEIGGMHLQGWQSVRGRGFEP
jgi:hypothetical protein